jgi:ECF transporter S component (folate family)
MKKVQYSTLWLAYTGVLVALQIVLGNLVQIALLEKQMNLGFLPIAAAGYLFGPVSAIIVAGLGDVLGTLVFGTGAYFPGFTLTALVVGCVYGLFMYPRNQKWLTKAIGNHTSDIAVRALISAALAAVVYIFLNSYWLTFFVPKGYWVLLMGRLPFNLAEIPIFTVVILLTCLALDRLPPTMLPPTLKHGMPADAASEAKQ